MEPLRKRRKFKKKKKKKKKKKEPGGRCSWAERLEGFFGRKN